MPKLETMHISEAPITGSQPPTGYVAWHEWAEVQYKAGLRQTKGPQDGKWKFPQELY